MRDEEKFDKALRLSNSFFLVECMFQISHTTLPVEIEVDNIAQKGNTLYVFEGKSKKEEKALTQLKVRHISFVIYRKKYIKWRILQKYSKIRLFYYSIKKRNLVEFNVKGRRLMSAKFRDINHLANILRKV